MAPATTTTAAPIPAAAQPVNDLTDLFNSVGTAVLPLLTLFGEQAIKQFFSISTGWADTLLVASGPIGIVTIVVMAIRVGGFKTLRAVIGRARESRADAEKEFLPSTSDEVCELWNGRDVVRVVEKPKGLVDLVVADLDITTPTTAGRARPTKRIFNISQAFEEDLEPKLFEDTLRSPSDIDIIANTASNLSLNVEGAVIKKQELWFWALAGLIVHLFTLAFPAIATYHFKWTRKGGAKVPVYAYECFLSGSIALMFGLLGCSSYVIHASTTETTFRPKIANGKTPIEQVLRLQFKSQGDSEDSRSYAILNRPKQSSCPENMTIQTSRLSNAFLSDEKVNMRYKLISLIASVLAILGFLCQVIGLSGLHWSAAFMVTFFSLLMTGVRAWVRRAFAEDPWCVPLPGRFELGWTAVRIRRNDWDDPGLLTRQRVEDFQWGILTGSLGSHRDKEDTARPNYIERSLRDGMLPDMKWAVRYSEQLETHLRRNCKTDTEATFAVGFLTEDTIGPSKQETTDVDLIEDLLSAHADKISDLPLGNCWDVAKKLATAIEKANMQVLKQEKMYFQFDDCWDLVWQIDVQQEMGKKASWFIPGILDPLYTFIYNDPDKLARQLCAGLYLWVCSLGCGKELANRAESYESVARDFLDPSDATKFVRIMGHCETPSAQGQIQEMEWWCGLKGGTLEARRPYDGVKSSLDRGNWPVFGLYHSAAFRMHTVSDSEVKTQRRFSLRDEDDDVRQDFSDIVFIPRDSRKLETECALEIFSLFLLSVCMALDGGEFGRAEKVQRKKILEQLAQQLVDARLVETRSEGLLYIVPAFSRFGLLSRNTTY